MRNLLLTTFLLCLLAGCRPVQAPAATGVPETSAPAPVTVPAAPEPQG